MLIPEAVQLILQAADIGKGGEIFIFKMPTVKIGDLAEVTIDYFAPKFGYEPNSIEIKKIGKRLGEKMHEELMNEIDAENTYENDEMFITISPQPKFSETGKFTLDIATNKKLKEFVKTKKTSYSSKDNKSLNKKEIIKLLK